MCESLSVCVCASMYVYAYVIIYTLYSLVKEVSHLEALVPLLDGGLVVAGVRLEELHVFFGQFFFAPETPHLDSLTHTPNTTCEQSNFKIR